MIGKLKQVARDAVNAAWHAAVAVIAAGLVFTSWSVVRVTLTAAGVAAAGAGVRVIVVAAARAAGLTPTEAQKLAAEAQEKAELYMKGLASGKLLAARAPVAPRTAPSFAPPPDVAPFVPLPVAPAPQDPPPAA